jgi:hypothetical protein
MVNVSFIPDFRTGAEGPKRRGQSNLAGFLLPYQVRPYFSSPSATEPPRSCLRTSKSIPSSVKASGIMVLRAFSISFLIEIGGLVVYAILGASSAVSIFEKTERNGMAIRSPMM